MRAETDRPLLPIDLRSIRLWAVLISLVIAVLLSTLFLMWLIDVLGGDALASAIDTARQPDYAHDVLLWTFIAIGLCLPPPAGWNSSREAGASGHYYQTRFLIFFGWSCLVPLLFLELFVEGASGFSLDLLPRPAFGLATVLIYFLSAAGFMFICLRDAKTGLWTWLRGEAPTVPWSSE